MFWLFFSLLKIFFSKFFWIFSSIFVVIIIHCCHHHHPLLLSLSSFVTMKKMNFFFFSFFWNCFEIVLYRFESRLCNEKASKFGDCYFEAFLFYSPMNAKEQITEGKLLPNVLLNGRFGSGRLTLMKGNLKNTAIPFSFLTAI